MRFSTLSSGENESSEKGLSFVGKCSPGNIQSRDDVVQRRSECSAVHSACSGGDADHGENKCCWSRSWECLHRAMEEHWVRLQNRSLREMVHRFHMTLGEGLWYRLQLYTLTSTLVYNRHCFAHEPRFETIFLPFFHFSIPNLIRNILAVLRTAVV